MAETITLLPEGPEMVERQEAAALAKRLSEYRKLMWSAPMKPDVEGRHQAVPLALLEDAIAFLAPAALEQG